MSEKDKKAEQVAKSAVELEESELDQAQGAGVIIHDKSGKGSATSDNLSFPPPREGGDD